MSTESPEVGSLGEEAAKLIAALSDWARDDGATGGAAGGSTDPIGVLREIDQHVATGASECTYCPVCQVIAGVRGVVREIDPEVREHLTAAASALVKAAAGLLAGPPAPRSAER